MRDSEYVRRVVKYHAMLKQRVYIEDYSDVPQGATVHFGERGGTFYETDDVESFQNYIESHTEAVMEEYSFNDEQLHAAKETVESYQEKAGERYAEVMNAIGDAAVGGTHRVKSVPSMMEKVYHRKPDKYDHPSDLNDIMGMRLYARSPTHCHDVAERVKELYGDKVTEFEDYVSEPKDGYYRAIHMTLEYENGDNAEVQIKSPEMEDVISVGHATVYKNVMNWSDDVLEDVKDCLEQVMARLFEEVDAANCSRAATEAINEARSLHS